MEKKTAFTLVELIVTITILAILWTIAFVNVRVYLIQSKNSKVLQDLNSVSSSLMAQTLQGQQALAFVSGTGSNIPNISLAWEVGGFTETQYKAGEINPTAFQIQKDKFLDPNTNHGYIIWATNIFPLTVFQVSGVITQPDSGRIVARIFWNYTPREQGTRIKVERVESQNNTISIPWSDLGYFYVGDTITNGVGRYQIIDISQDGSSIVLNNVHSLSKGDEIRLFAPETEGLIGSKDDTTKPVINLGTSLPY